MPTPTAIRPTRARIMWRWRDWVIDAFNRNMPFDQFTIEQLAGDLLPGATLDQQIATGFNRNHRGNAEGGIIPEEYAVEYVVDRVDTTATVWLGLTLGCARCHDHKFDPITQQEFYQLFAFFNNVPENGRAVKYGNSPPFIKAPTRAQQRAARPRCEQPSRRARAAGWQRPRAGDRDGAGRLGKSSIRRPPGDRLVRRSEHRGRSRSGALRRHRHDRPGERDPVDAGDVARVRLLRQVHARAPGSSPDGPRAGTILSRMVDEPQGDGYSVVLDRGKVQVNLVKRWLDDAIRVETKSAVAADRWTHVAVTYDGSRVADGVKVYLDGELAPLTVLLDELNQIVRDRRSRSGSAPAAAPRAGSTGAIDERSVYDAALGPKTIAILADARVDREDRGDVRPRRRTPGQAREAPPVLPGDRGAPTAIRTPGSELDGARTELAAFIEQHPHDDGHAGDAGPAPTHVLIRGQYDQPGPSVSARRAGAVCRRCRRATAPTGWRWPAGSSTRPTR